MFFMAINDYAISKLCKDNVGIKSFINNNYITFTF